MSNNVTSRVKGIFDTHEELRSFLRKKEKLKTRKTIIAEQAGVSPAMVSQILSEIRHAGPDPDRTILIKKLNSYWKPTIEVDPI
jgi:predicted transcriptional regulator